MASVTEQIESANTVICGNIDALNGQRGLLSQNVLAQLRNLVEGVAVRLHTNDPDTLFHYDAVAPALSFVGSRGRLNFLAKFHKLLKRSTSHYTLDGDASERLMLKYFEYLYRIRQLLRLRLGLSVLENLEKFPVDLDPSLKEYHQKIAERIQSARSIQLQPASQDRYYIHRSRPFFVDGSVFYEITFYRAINRVSKFDRIIGFTDIDLTEEYAAQLALASDAIEVLDQQMPVILVLGWDVSIRPCEFDNLGKLVGVDLKTRTDSKEYRELMQALTRGSSNLLDLVDLDDARYQHFRERATDGMTTPKVFPMLDQVRETVRTRSKGSNVLRYLLLRMRNDVIKHQHIDEPCPMLSDMYLKRGCIPFDTMPFCTSLIRHNPRISDLVASLNVEERNDELLARRVKTNVDRHGVLYTPLDEVQGLGDVETLCQTHNAKLYHTHTHRELVTDKGHIFVRGYEDDTAEIIEILQERASKGVAGYTPAVEQWLAETAITVDDPIKRAALIELFSHSRAALIYGAAGTGKSTMVNLIANYFNEKSKLFLAHTHPAVDNLKRKVKAQRSEFSTISRQIHNPGANDRYELLVIDECSTVSNADLLKILEGITCELVVLVGDTYQIESIQFGNWFGIINRFLPPTSVFELTTPFRTKNEQLLTFWTKTRHLDSDLAEVMAENGYSTVLDQSLFEPGSDDEIILCLNYDGLYGINNVNRFLQSSNEPPRVYRRLFCVSQAASA